jgi:hypothetical protein
MPASLYAQDIVNPDVAPVWINPGVASVWLFTTVASPAGRRTTAGAWAHGRCGRDELGRRTDDVGEASPLIELPFATWACGNVTSEGEGRRRGDSDSPAGTCQLSNFRPKCGDDSANKEGGAR